jgi:hypothetical protein
MARQFDGAHYRMATEGYLVLTDAQARQMRAHLPAISR